MYLVKYNRRNNALNSNPMSRLLNDFWNAAEWPNSYEEDSTVWAPRIDVEENENEYQVYADVPGLNKKDVSITLEDGVLTIKGERKREEKKEDQNTSYMERNHGNFSRSFTLPSKVDEKKIAANLKDGVLSVSLPKAEVVKPKEIAIS